MSIFARRIGHALTRNRTATAQDHWDPRLRGRIYAIPFETVWQAALQLAGGGLRRWKIMHSDDYEGTIHAEAKTFFLRSVGDVHIHIWLDEDAQTRVDVVSASRKGKADFGKNARRIARFIRALDKRLANPPAGR